MGDSVREGGTEGWEGTVEQGEGQREGRGSENGKGGEGGVR